VNRGERSFIVEEMLRHRLLSYSEAAIALNFEETSMKIEIGKKYTVREPGKSTGTRCRRGTIKYAEVMSGGSSGLWHIVFMYTDGTTDDRIYWNMRDSGVQITGTELPDDLVAEYVDPTTCTITDSDWGIFSSPEMPTGISAQETALCNCEYVNVGFATVTMACKHCGKSQEVV